MAGTKEIRTKIKSIKNTQKITGAMEMVAASKMRKAQDRMSASKPYAQQIQKVISHLAKSHNEYDHDYLDQREIKTVGFIIVSTDRGLCGGLNINLFKAALKQIESYRKKGVAVKLCLIGSKAESFFRRFGDDVVSSAGHFGDAPTVASLIGAVKSMIDRYDSGTIDLLYLVNNEFVNTMLQKPTLLQLLPLKPSKEKVYDYYWDYIYEPDAREILTKLLKRYIESEVYQAVVENIACEQAARMVAMKAASDNAGDLIDKFQLAYNKARQAAITQELSEIIGGAAAV